MRQFIDSADLFLCYQVFHLFLAYYMLLYHSWSQ
jgi:hypothetical protein